MVFKKPISFCTKFVSIDIAQKLNHFFFPFFVSFFVFVFSSCKAFMAKNHSSFDAFNSINDTHWEKVVMPTYSWDVKITHDLIDS